MFSLLKTFLSNFFPFSGGKKDGDTCFDFGDGLSIMSWEEGKKVNLGKRFNIER